VIGAVVLVAGASDAQAAKVRLPLFDLFGLGTPHVLVLDGGRNAVQLDGQGNGNGNQKIQLAPKVGPDDSRPVPWTSVNYADNGDWSPKGNGHTDTGDQTPQGTDQTDTGDWQQTPEQQDTPEWTMTTVTNNNP
jgi:hypothetical protein